MAVVGVAPPAVWEIPGGISRRAALGCALAAGGALWLRGCVQQAQPAGPPVTVAIFPGDTLTLIPGLLSSYEEANSSVRLVATATTGQTGPYQMATRFGDLPADGGPGFSTVSLSAALRKANFNGDRPLAGSLASFTAGGQVYGLPYVVAPWSVSYRRDAFAAAGLTEPAVRWTVGDFERACAALQASITAGRAPAGVQWTLPVAAGTKRTKYGAAHGFLNDPTLAAAFAAGYGSPLFSGGQFRLTAPGAVEALSKLILIARLYAAPTSALTVPSPGQAVLPFPSAMEWGFGAQTVAPRAAATTADARWRYARFPVLPEVPLVPVTYSGIYVYRTGPHQLPGGDAVDPHVDAAVRFGIWLYEAPQQVTLMGAGFPPIVHDARTQATFWSVQPLGLAAVGDWRSFTDVRAGWPAGAAASAIATALQAEVAEPGSLAARLSAAQDTLNYRLP